MGSKSYIGFLCLCLAVMAGFSHGVEVVEEENMQIEVIENGTVGAVILDCPYTLEETKTVEEIKKAGLNIKWYHRGSPIFFYQWIPGHEPKALGIFENHIDLTYKATENAVDEHSAIRIINPTTVHGGDFICRVATFENEKNIKRKLVVYSKPSKVHVWAEEEGEDSVKVTCEVDNVFPEPKVNLHMMAEDDDNKIILERAKEKTSWSEGVYSKTLELVMKEDDIDGPTHFGCEVTIPNTNVEVLNKTHYEPRVHEVAGAVMSGSAARSAFAIVVSLAFLALWRI